MNNKRKTLQKIAGIGAVATVLPSSWIKPVISSVVLPVHAQTSANTPPVGQNITVNDIFEATASVDLAALISDADGDSLTVNLEGSGVLSGDIINLTAEIVGTIVSVTISAGGGSAFVDYSVSDQIAKSPIFRITFVELLF